MTPVLDQVAGTYLPVGHVLQGRYRIVGEVGRGGYSVVYHAEDLSLGADVAVKLLVPPPATAHLARERMKREVRAVRGLSHPNIVELYDFLEEGPWCFIVMELVRGEDLATRVARKGVLDPTQVAHVGAQIADALAAAHARGVLHRDVKPHNILIDAKGNARLVDFGSARLDGLDTVTQTGGIVGTLAYTAPEVLAGKRADARADVYSLGRTMTFGLGGYLPESLGSQVAQGYFPDAIHPKAERTDVPDWLDTVIARATASQPGRRFPTAASMRDALVEQGRHAVDPLTGEMSECIVCGDLDPFNMSLCVKCSGVASDADTLVFLDPPKWTGSVAARGSGSLVFGRGRSRGEIAEVMHGERALVRVPPPAAERIVQLLAKRDFPSFAVAAGRVGRALPRRFFGLLIAVIGVGGVAAWSVDMKLAVASPVIALLLWLLAVRVARRPLIEIGSNKSSLPAWLETRVVDVLSSLPAGTARDLLAELVRTTNQSYHPVPGTNPNAHVAPAIEDLLGAACDVAADLAACDERLTTLAHQHHGKQDPNALVEFARLESFRYQLVQRFLEATAVVTRIRSHAWDVGAASERLREATNNLTLHVEAMAEVDRLLA